MSNKSWSLVLIVIALSLVFALLAGCNQEEDTPQVGTISDVNISTAVDDHDQPIQPKTVFPSDTEAFYCSFRVSHFPPNSKILVEWIYVTGEAVDEVGENNMFQVNTGTLTGDGYTSIALEMPDYADYAWPQGEYKVVLSVNSEEKASTTFNVE